MVKSKKQKEGNGVVKSVLTAYFIILLHLVLIMIVGLLVLFFRGIVNYMIWVLLGGIAIVLGVIYYFFRRLKSEGKAIRETLNSPVFSNRNVEVSFLGGLASCRIGQPRDDMPTLDRGQARSVMQLEDPETMRIRQLTELGRMLEKNFITIEEFNKAKNKILHSDETIA
ncbi:MAG: hypothetical protein PHP23_05230 [Desulfobacterales bacterium]|nr:hypothetical protein [Desulfobacterales bacterium]MDD4071991.1 hypothetical protein [Desulfobacterales bacterium]MDD4392259.1 hypothetical protein [Desulfobacterales bacterium]